MGALKKAYGSERFHFRYGDEEKGIADPKEVRLRRIGEIAKRRALERGGYIAPRLGGTTVSCPTCHDEFEVKRKTKRPQFCEACTESYRDSVSTFESQELEDGDIVHVLNDRSMEEL